jgi:tripeptidyl-peptidase-1
MKWFAFAAIAQAEALAQEHRVTFYVKQHGAAKLREEAWLVSDPTSERYGDFLSFEEVVELQRPTEDHLAMVHAHLDRLGVRDRRATVAGDKIVATVPQTLLASASVIPADLSTVMDGVRTGATTIDHALLRKRRTEPRRIKADSGLNNLPSCFFEYQITPSCIRSQYNVDQLPRATHPENRQTVVVNQFFSAGDLKQALAQNSLPDQEIAKQVNGDSTGQHAGLEASVDTQMIVAFGGGTETWWTYIDGHVENPFDSWLTYMSNSSTIPWVHSLSVGEPEDELASFAGRMNDEFAALGARGATLVFASGDSGYQPKQKFPASSPFVTAVGGIWNGELGGDNYFSVDDISTGGFSSLEENPLPEYQKQAVAHYETIGGGPTHNASRRCVPDLSLFDNGVQVRVNGGNTASGGTSFSAPMLSGMLSLINDVLLHGGHSPLGFVNPLLYANADAFFDITKGGNNGFNAVVGYDPASGLGTFDDATLGKLRDAAVAAKLAAASKRRQGVSV